jgi:class 3 adenylate cyclase
MGKRVAEGPVTILFTDVEGSTALHAAKGDAEAQGDPATTLSASRFASIAAGPSSRLI